MTSVVAVLLWSAIWAGMVRAMSLLPFFRTQEVHLDILQRSQCEGRNCDDRCNGRVHVRIVGDRSVIGNEIADTGRSDQQFSKHDADEAGGDTEPQTGEKHRRRVRNDDLENLLRPRPLKGAAHVNE